MLEMYGAQPGDGSFASNCLLARRLAERGVRFIQLYHRDWDHHCGREGERGVQGRGSGPGHRGADHRSEAARACWTIRWWSGAANSAARRCRRAATGATTTSRASPSCWPAAASRGGITYGATDELGYAAVENPGQRARFPRHHAAPAGHRPQAPDGEVPGPGRAPDRHLRQRGKAASGLAGRWSHGFRRTTPLKVSPMDGSSLFAGMYRSSRDAG